MTMKISRRLCDFLSRPIEMHFGSRWLLRSLAAAALFAGALTAADAMVNRPHLIDNPPKLEHIDLDNPMGRSLAAAAIDIAAHVRTDPMAAYHEANWKKYQSAQKIRVLEGYQARFLKKFPGVPDLAIRRYTEDSDVSAYVNDATGPALYAVVFAADVDRARIHFNMALSDDFGSDLNTIVHETVHTVQVSYLARALINQLEAERDGSRLTEEETLIGTVARKNWLASRKAMIEGLTVLAGDVQLPPGHERQMRQLLVSTLISSKQYDDEYMMVYAEQQAFKTADCMTEMIEAPSVYVEALPAERITATFLACAANHRLSELKFGEWKPAAVKPAQTAPRV